MSKVTQYALAFVENRLADAEDNFRRAEACFRGYDEKAMALMHGESGITRKELLDDYRKNLEHWRAELKELNTEFGK